MQSLVDPAESLAALVSSIGSLQEQIQQVQQYSKEAAAMGAPEGGEVEQGGADDAYRAREAVDPKEKLMSSMLLARPAATSVQEDMERLVGRLRREIGKIEGTLTDKMDQVEHQIKNLPDAKPKGDDSGTPPPASDGAEDDDGADSDDMQLYLLRSNRYICHPNPSICPPVCGFLGSFYDTYIDRIRSDDDGELSAEDGEMSPGGSPRVGGAPSKVSRATSRMRAAAAMEKVAGKVSSDALVRTIWVRSLPQRRCRCRCRVQLQHSSSTRSCV